MKLLYALQGTGNGHLSRARDIIPLLDKKAELDVLISGTQADISLDYPVKYRLNGLSFVFGKKGGVDLKQTLLRANSRKFISEITKLPVSQYDLIINDFEPVSAWAAKLTGKPCIGLSHQRAVLSPFAPKPKEDDLAGRLILKNYAPVPAGYGFHFEAYDPTIYTPVIRQQIRKALIQDKGHYTVYLPAYDDGRLFNFLSRFKQVRWEVFSKHNKSAFTLGNVSVRPLNNTAFIESMAASRGILCGAGFETPAEALYLRKKLLVIPMKNQYEQQCNAAALKKMGVPVIKKLHVKYTDAIYEWLESQTIIEVNYPDITQQVIDTILHTHLPLSTPALPEYLWDKPLRIKPV
ncbi:glycosyltransferase family protein [Rhodocytophaga aerolata]|uniref:Glycosyltransferase family protein n=1 Tax=Rhodocytophaga aerolata TaxID=455078 RepID=A0ABT8R073_9BACT|nr:glycosyltransferase family protein [Rhodocytophaga aerolata]MDO1444713.1 glycosyltransferase family protein [Rhodocytophaga aerolata]